MSVIFAESHTELALHIIICYWVLLADCRADAGSPSYFHFENAIQRVTGLPQVIPTHQGRAAESLLFRVLCKPGDIVPNNTHFDTTKANVQSQAATALNLPCQESRELSTRRPFKGNMDVKALRECLARHGSAKRVPLVMMTVTNNSAGA